MMNKRHHTNEKMVDEERYLSLQKSSVLKTEERQDRT